MKKRTSEPLAVPMSSMIDVVFLLLIYFIVTMQDDISVAHLAVNLPTASAPPANATAEELRLIRIYVNETILQYQVPPKPRRSVTPGQLQDFLKNNKDHAAQSDLIISVCSNASMQSLVTVLDFCAQYGFTKLNILRAND